MKVTSSSIFNLSMILAKFHRHPDVSCIDGITDKQYSSIDFKLIREKQSPMRILLSHQQRTHWMLCLDSVESSPHKEQMSAGKVHCSERAAQVRRWRPVCSLGHRRPERSARHFRINIIALASRKFQNVARQAGFLSSPSLPSRENFKRHWSTIPVQAINSKHYQYGHVSILFLRPDMKGRRREFYV